MTGGPVEPLDPDSERAQAFLAVLADVEQSIAARKRQQALLEEARRPRTGT